MKNILYYSTGHNLLSPTRIAGMTRFAKTKGWNLVARSAYKMSLNELIEFWHPIGCIFDNGNDSFDDPLPKGLPYVWLSRDPALLGKNEYLVDQDSFETGRLAADELVGKGLSHFAYVGFYQRQWWSQQRCEGFKERLNRHGMESPAVFASRESKDRIAKLRAFLQKLPTPCGIFCATDGIAEEVVSLCKACDLAVPEIVSVLGVDDYEIVCESCTPTLTSVNPDFELGGYLAAQVLGELIDGHRPRKHIFWHPPRGVVRRQSTQRLAHFETRVSSALEYIRSHVAEGLSVAQIADVMNCSRRLAETLFREATGDTILKAINDALFDRACKMLEQQQLPVNVVSDMLQLSPTALRKIFVDRVGQNPLKWCKAREAVRFASICDEEK